MVVERMIMELLRFKPEREVKVKMGDGMNPAHYTLEVEENGLGDAVIVCTFKVDEPEDHYPSEPSESER